jgi:hypothetical protein
MLFVPEEANVDRFRGAPKSQHKREKRGLGGAD